ncbi:MAG: glycosyltransferase [Clostridia bacterium]|nr:glycosyltransferase [Clostridia bacterium]
MKLSVIIPMYNEEPVIGRTASELTSFLDSFLPGDYEVLFVNDGSTDRSAEVITEYAESHPAVRLVSYSPNRGKGSAVRTGMLAAQGDIRMFTDADLAYGTEVIGKFVSAFEEEADAKAAVGTRTAGGGGYGDYSLLRKIASSIFLKILAAAGKLPVSDSQCGCKAFVADAADSIFRECATDGYAFDFEVLLRAEKKGLKIVEVPVTILRHGDSKVRVVRDSIKMLRDVRRIRKKVYASD